MKADELTREEADAAKQFTHSLWQYTRESAQERYEIPPDAPHFAILVLQQLQEKYNTPEAPYFIWENGLKVYTTLDWDLQTYAECVARSHIAAQQHFIDCLASGTEFETSGAAMLKTMALIHGAYQSAAENRVVDLAELLPHAVDGDLYRPRADSQSGGGIGLRETFDIANQPRLECLEVFHLSGLCERIPHGIQPALHHRERPMAVEIGVAGLGSRIRDGKAG